MVINNQISSQYFYVRPHYKLIIYIGGYREGFFFSPYPLSYIEFVSTDIVALRLLFFPRVTATTAELRSIIVAGIF